MATTRSLCPLACGWHHDEDDAQPAAAATVNLTPDMGIGDITSAVAFAMLKVTLERAESAIRTHLETHELLEWAQAVTRLQREAASVVEECGGLMSGGGVNVWPDDPELLDIYPLAKRIEHGRRFGGKVLRRRVIIVEDWEEVQ